MQKANALKIGAPTCIFAQMFIGPPKSEIATLFSVATTDWVLLSEMIKSIDSIARRTIAGDAALEMSNHSSGKLGDFWEGIYKSFT
jgi:hypothetical protein